MLTSALTSPNVSTARSMSALRLLGVGDVVVAGDGLAAHRRDLVDDLLGRRRVGAGAVGAAAEVVDDDLGALAGEQQRVLPADAPAGPGDDGDPAVELAHVAVSSTSSLRSALDPGRCAASS